MALELLLYAALLVATAGCVEGGGGGGPFHCTYEERTSAGCNSSAWTDWEAGCSVVDFELREGLSREQFCIDAYGTSDTHCAGGCCKKFQYRNTAAASGNCP